MSRYKSDLERIILEEPDYETEPDNDERSDLDE